MTLWTLVTWLRNKALVRNCFRHTGQCKDVMGQIGGFTTRPYVSKYVCTHFYMSLVEVVCSHVCTSFFVRLCCDDVYALIGSHVENSLTVCAILCAVDISLTVWYFLWGCTLAIPVLVTAATFDFMFIYAVSMTFLLTLVTLKIFGSVSLLLWRYLSWPPVVTITCINGSNYKRILPHCELVLVFIVAKKGHRCTIEVGWQATQYWRICRWSFDVERKRRSDALSALIQRKFTVLESTIHLFICFMTISHTTIQTGLNYRRSTLIKFGTSQN